MRLIPRSRPAEPAAVQPARRQMIPPTVARRYAFRDHLPPTGRHARGREQAQQWKGTSRTVHRAARKRANRRTWHAELAEARRAAVTTALTTTLAAPVLEPTPATDGPPFTHTLTWVDEVVQ